MKTNFSAMKYINQILHGAGAISFIVAYLSSDSESLRVLHVYCGYAFGAIFIIRILLGLFPNSSHSLQAIWRRANLGKTLYIDIKKLEIKRLMHWQRWYGAIMGFIIISMYALVPPMILAGIGAYEEFGGRWARKMMENSHEALGELYLMMVIIHLTLIAMRHLLLKYQNHTAALSIE